MYTCKYILIANPMNLGIYVITFNKIISSNKNND